MAGVRARGSERGAGLPLPVAVLARRVRNAKSPKERHDTAYYAWEASVRLAVAARPPADPGPLALPSAGHWVGALEGGDGLLDHPALLAVFGLFSEVGLGRRASPKAVTPRGLLEPLPAYRNQVVGHGATRTADFYDGAAAALLEGIEAAWAASVFFPEGGSLAYVEAVELDPGGARRARVLDLTGLNPELAPAGAPVPEGVLPRRLYLRQGGGGDALTPTLSPPRAPPRAAAVSAGCGPPGGGPGASPGEREKYRPLHPWLLYQETELSERVLLLPRPQADVRVGRRRGARRRRRSAGRPRTPSRSRTGASPASTTRRATGPSRRRTRSWPRPSSRGRSRTTTTRTRAAACSRRGPSGRGSSSRPRASTARSWASP